MAHGKMPKQELMRSLAAAVLERAAASACAAAAKERRLLGRFVILDASEASEASECEALLSWRRTALQPEVLQHLDDGDKQDSGEDVGGERLVFKTPLVLQALLMGRDTVSLGVALDGITDAVPMAVIACAGQASSVWCRPLHADEMATLCRNLATLRAMLAGSSRASTTSTPSTSQTSATSPTAMRERSKRTVSIEGSCMGLPAGRECLLYASNELDACVHVRDQSSGRLLYGLLIENALRV
jgi:hypothetical protein